MLMKVKRYSIAQGICIDANPERFVMEADYQALVCVAKRVLERFYDPGVQDDKQFSELIALRDIVRQESL